MKARAKRFGSDESGVMIPMTIGFLIMMLMMGGMAVDFMRFESRRTMLQSTADRAVLAAAGVTELDSTKAKAVVYDYFEKSGYSADDIKSAGIVTVNGIDGVGVTASFKLDTIFLRLLGINELAAPATATAISGAADIEVSLVVDISGSMEEPVTPEDGSSSTQTKIEALRAAATRFVNTMLIDEYKDKISISLVPYSEQVNIGPDLMDKLPVDKKFDFSHCVAFEDSDFNELGIRTSGDYKQDQHYQYNWTWNGYGYDNDLSETICPRHAYERVIPQTQDKDRLNLAISQLQARAGTSIAIGLKWGLALLDPSLKAPLASLTESVFTTRPGKYPVDIADGEDETQKVVVLMTDGQNSNSGRLRDKFYRTPSQRAYWAFNNLVYHWSTVDDYQNGFGYYLYDRQTNHTANIWMRQLCTKAKEKGVIIYAVAIEATADGEREMAACASSDAHFFKASGDQLESIFGAIAKQITDLRLAL